VRTLFLLYPEWQGCGTTAAVQEGALTIARELLPETHFLIVDSPDEERLDRERGVVGLRSIAERFAETLARVRRAAPDAILTIGGTCGVEAVPVGYLNERYAGDLAVVWLDAHGDLNTPESSPSGHFHGMVLRTLLGEGPDEFVRELQCPLEPAQVFLAATRDLDPPELEFVGRVGISVSPPGALADPDMLADEIDARGFTRVYLHLDLDALDPAEFPDTLIPTAAGPPLSAVRSTMELLARRFTVAGASIVEYVHRRDASLRAIDDLLGATSMMNKRPTR
jgi:arginase